MAKKQMRTLGTLTTLLAAVVACQPQAGKHGRGGGEGDDGSVLTSIDGISAEDKAREGRLGYFLDCDTFREGGSLREKDGKTYIRFDGSKIKDNETSCALEIQAPQDGSMKLDDYEWYGRKAADVVKGLMYASNRVVAKDRKLDLKIYVLYAAKDPKASFDLEVAGTLELGDGDVKPTATTGLQLECDGGFKHPGVYVPGSDSSASIVLKFEKISVESARGKTCSKIAMTAAAGGKDLSWEAVTDISLPSPQKGETLKFPGNDRTYAFRKVTSAQPDPGSVLADPKSAGPCLDFVQNEGCKDHKAQAIAPLQAPASYVWVKIDGRRGDGPKETLIVGAGDRGFGLFAGAALTLDAITESIKQPSPRAFNWYRTLPDANMRQLPFDARFVSGAASEADKVEVASLQDFKPLHIGETWVHGFHELESLAALNAKASAHWYVTLNVKKDNATVATLIVSDKTKYLYSSSPIATLEGGGTAFFDLESFKLNKPTPGSDKAWAIWSVKGGSAVDASCTMEATYLRSAFSQRHLDNLAPEGGDATLDACAVTREKFDQLYGTGHEIALERIWVWEWYQLAQARP